MKRLFVFALILLFISCKPSDDELKKKIVGDWKRVYDFKSSNEDLHEAELLDESFYVTFRNTGIVDFKSPFYRRPMGKIIRDKNHQPSFKFISLGTNWKINNSVLNIYNPADSTWNESEILKLTEDTLELFLQKKYNRIYVRRPYLPVNSCVFDKVAIYTSGCYGECPNTYTIISSSGDMSFYGGWYTGKEGYYSYKAPEFVFDSIAHAFKQANILHLHDKYDPFHTDGRTVYVSFVRNDTIIKSIEDNGSAPVNLQWGYFLLEHLYQILPITKDTKNIAFDFNGFPFLLQYDKRDICLYPTECFLLYTYLQKGKPTQEKLKANYSFCIYSRDKNKCSTRIKTDGKIYEITDSTHHKTKIDIGFNFFEANMKGKRITSQ